MQHYIRELDIENAVHTISYSSEGIRFKREYFSSFKDQVMVLRISSSQKGSCSGVINLTDMHNGKIEATGNKISVNGKLDNGLIYESEILVLNDGGKVKVLDNSLMFEKTNSVIIILAAGTNYLPNYKKGWRGEIPHRVLENQLEKASRLSYKELLSRHIYDYKHLFDRVNLNLGESNSNICKLSTDQRLIAYKGGGY